MVGRKAALTDAPSVVQMEASMVGYSVARSDVCWVASTDAMWVATMETH